MAKMGKYCKAYPITRFRSYPSWSESSVNSRTEAQAVDGNDAQAPHVLADDDYLYLQENFVVTGGIFIDQHIIFEKVTDEWKEFCRNTLKFDENGHLEIKEREAVSTD